MSRIIEEPVITAAEWMAVMAPLLEEGHALRIMPRGNSMVPFVTGGRDEVILAAVGQHALKRRDIILYALPEGVHVLHRIHHIQGNKIYTLGDYQTRIEGPYEASQIYAVVKTIIRKGKVISCGSRVYNMLSELWLRMRPFRRPIARVWNCLRCRAHRT